MTTVRAANGPHGGALPATMSYVESRGVDRTAVRDVAVTHRQPYPELRAEVRERCTRSFRGHAAAWGPEEGLLAKSVAALPRAGYLAGLIPREDRAAGLS